MSAPTAVDIVVPTLGRPSLHSLLAALRAGPGARLPRIVVVDDRPRADRPLPVAPGVDVDVLRGRAAGPAAARNVGWKATRAEWVAFLDDDVVPPGDWLRALHDDLAGLAPWVAASQGRVDVPMPAGRRPTDWERNVGGLRDAAWVTADMAYRRDALIRLGGFDERFRRAYREDADLALRAMRAGWRLARGRRRVEHPVPPADWRVSVRLQAGNGDDVLMRALHGPGWRAAAQAPRGRLSAHLVTTGAGAAALAGLAARRPGLARAAGAVWAARTAELARCRIAPGPRSRAEVVRMVATSVLIPPAAAAHLVRGLARHPRDPVPSHAAGPPVPAPHGLPEVVLLDRDGTLVIDVPFNGDPARVRCMPGALAAVDRLRAAGVRLAVVSNQSGIARGLLGEEQVEAVNRRVDELLGPLGPFLYCPHGPQEGCACRKPAPGLVLAAARRLGVAPGRCTMIGDIAGDVEAAHRAGAAAVLVPTAQTRRDEIAAAHLVAPTLAAAVDLILRSQPEPAAVAA